MPLITPPQRPKNHTQIPPFADPRWINRRTLREDLISVDTSGATKGTGLPRHRFAAKKPQKEPEIRPTRKQSPVREKTEPERTKKEQKIKDDVRAKLKSQTKFSVPEERPKTAGGARRPQSSAGKKKNTETSAAKPTFDDKDKVRTKPLDRFRRTRDQNTRNRATFKEGYLGQARRVVRLRVFVRKAFDGIRGRENRR